MGFLFFETLDRISVSPELRTGILTGGLGTYTTFSTFSVETLVLFENGEPAKGLIYVFSTMVLCLGATFAGAWISRSI
jgi:Integral membrane protein possibly involved in chromosome condensation